MSKIVDPENMSKFDRQYLSDRGIDPDEYASPAVEEDEEDDEPTESDGEDVPYTEWKLAELKAELKQRNLSYAGKDPAVLITRLEESDAEQAEASDAEGDDDDEGDDDADA